MASTYIPPMSRRSLGGQVRQRSWDHAGPHGTYPLLLLVAAGVFVITVGALLMAQSGLSFRAPGTTRTAGSPAASAPAPAAPLSPADVETVLSYAGTLRADDPLVQVRPGVYAKKSNVEGIRVGDRTVYYDIVPHQSYGPLRSGKLSEGQVDILARDGQNGVMVLIYAKRP